MGSFFSKSLGHSFLGRNGLILIVKMFFFYLEMGLGFWDIISDWLYYY